MQTFTWSSLHHPGVYSFLLVSDILHITQFSGTLNRITASVLNSSVAWAAKHNQPPPRNSEGPSKSCHTQPNCEKPLKIAEFRTPTPQDVPKKGSKILKLPPVRNCFTSAMTNKLVVIINSLKVTKIKKILLYEMKFLVPNYSCLQNPWLGGYSPLVGGSVCPLSLTEFVEPHPKQNSWVHHCKYHHFIWYCYLHFCGADIGCLPSTCILVPVLIVQK